MEMLRHFMLFRRDVTVLLWWSTKKEQEQLQATCAELGVTNMLGCRLPSFLPLRLRLLYWEMLWIPWQLAMHRGSVYFSPTVHPMLWHTKALDMHMVLHDAFQFTEKAYLRGWTRKLYNVLLRRTIRHQRIRLHTVSKTSADAIKTALDIRKPICIAGNGIDHLQKVEPEAWTSLHKELQLEKPYILYQGGYDERKNVRTLIELFPLVREAIPTVQLVLCGNALHASPLYGDPKQWAKEPGVHITGFVTRARLRRLFADAALVVSPTRAEGFNIVIGEALMEGVTVVASDIAVHRELWGNHALLTDFSQKKASADLLIAVLQGNIQGTPLSAEEKRVLSWEHQAGQILATLV